MILLGVTVSCVILGISPISYYKPVAFLLVWIAYYVCEFGLYSIRQYWSAREIGRGTVRPAAAVSYVCSGVVLFVVSTFFGVIWSSYLQNIYTHHNYGRTIAKIHEGPPVYHERITESGYLIKGTGYYVGGEYISHGKMRMYTSNDVLVAEYHAVAGRLNGKARYFHPDDSSLSDVVTMRNGKPHGIATEYAPSGEVAARTLYWHGIELHHREYNESRRE